MNITRPLVTALLTVFISACSQTPLPSSNSIGLSAQRLGTAAYDGVVDVDVDRKLGAIYAFGSTVGSLDGPNRGGVDVFLRRYNRNGTVVWKRQLGSTLEDTAGGVAVAPSGAVFVGYTQTEGAYYVGDGLLQKFSAAGARLWTRRFRVDDNLTEVTSVATDSSGNVFVGGSLATQGAFVRKYSSSGTVLWTYVFFGDGIVQEVEALTTDSAGNVYAGGGDYDDSWFTNFLIKLSPSGKPLFSTQLSAGSSGMTNIHDIHVAGSALYVAGSKTYYYDTPSEERDAFIGKYTLGGVAQWQRTFGTRSGDSAFGLSADSSGGLYVTGYTCGRLGSVDPGGCDVFLRKYSGSSAVLWTKQIGSSGFDVGTAVAAYSSSELYLAGEAGGALADTTHRGGQDGFLRRTDGQGNRVWTDQ